MAASQGPPRSTAAGSAGRLFLAALLTDEAREAIRVHLDVHLKSRPLPGRPVRPESWHLTLRFLGDTTPEAFADIRRRLDDSDWPAAFAVRFAGLGAFPRADRPRVLWLGVDQGADQVAHLAVLCEAAAVGAGFSPERRPFTSHLTLSRFDRPLDITRWIQSVPPIGLSMPVDEVALMRSHLGQGPPVYERVAAWALGAETHDAGD